MDVRQSIPSNGGEWNSKFGSLWGTQIQKVKDQFGAKLTEVWLPEKDKTDVPILFVDKTAIVQVLRFLKEDSDCLYTFLSDITATDEEVSPRFQVVYQLYSPSQGCRIRIKVKLEENEEIPTATVVWKGADWAEREVYDMFGIRFQGHPDLRRILMDNRWQGHPLRKDYPLRGYQVFTEPMEADPSLLE